jgi:hypothetical protein
MEKRGSFLTPSKGWRHRRTYAPGNTILLLVGDLSADEARRIA